MRAQTNTGAKSRKSWKYFICGYNLVDTFKVGCITCICAQLYFKSPYMRQLLMNRCNFSSCAFMFSSESNNVIDSFKTNPFFNKYADKIAVLQRTSPEEFLARIEATKSKKKVAPSNKQHTFTEAAASAKPKLASLPTYHKEQKLDSVMKTELLKDKTSAEISKIWEDYHKNQDKIVATIPAKTYTVIFENSVKFPTFLYPLPREQGCEFYVAQFSGNECHFTSLINYQAHKENAPECLTMIHYTEFLDDKGIVLMCGEFDKNALSGSDARCLANQLQLYYSSSCNDRKYQLLNTFNYSPDSFKHMDLITELHNLSP